MQHRISVLAWSPLAGGRLGAPGDDERAQRVCAELDAQAKRCGVSRAAATYAWIMAHPAGIVPIVGSQQVSRIRAAADAYKVIWTRADWYRVLVASRGVALP
jgi:predicted oxidoreductase